MTDRRRSEEPRLPPIQHSKIHVKTSQQNSYSFRYYYRIHTKLIQFKHLELSQLSHTTLTKQIMNHATTNCHHIRLNSWWIRILRWCKCCSSLKWLQWLGTRILRWCKCCSPTLSPKWLQWTAAFATVWIYSRCMFITKWYKPLSWCTRQCWRWWWDVTWTGYRWQSQRRLLNITHPLPPLPPVLSTWKDLTAGFEWESLGDGYRWQSQIWSLNIYSPRLNLNASIFLPPIVGYDLRLRSLTVIVCSRLEFWGTDKSKMIIQVEHGRLLIKTDPSWCALVDGGGPPVGRETIGAMVAVKIMNATAWESLNWTMLNEEMQGKV